MARHDPRPADGSFSQALQEVIDSRVWGGIHWRTADVDGARLGKRIARWERSRYFKPVGGGAR
jgi:hypothetical protein